ncbi:uncharacterized protein LOC130781035 [Actinidia eriantha]|uniref:uncharacterized protein LOC130781035 n=1 Tax=Actinidia eriantha TaxID=165200 RepID=UPI002583A916|nr:uncharacterized protein LOC130781035 [Actinidia eriantha]XP_057496062.1 uncharacterized protein LOC130781035 [Actinidia eriantha]
MTIKESAQKTTPPQLVTLDKALKLAEQWVNNKTKSTEEEPAVVELEGRPARLGLGATVPRQSKVGPLNDPVERKLYAKLQVEKRKAAKNKENSKSSARERHDVQDDEDEDENESRTNLFSKKRLVPLTSSLQAKKKK